MVDPSDAMYSFQNALLNGNIKLQRGALNPDVYLHADELPDGQYRLTYVGLEQTTVTTFVNFVPCSPIDRIPCFQIGYAVPIAYRNQGRAKKLIEMALSEMQYGFRRAGITLLSVDSVYGSYMQVVCDYRC